MNIRNTVNVQTENSVIRNILFIPGNSIQYNYVTSALLLLQLWKTIWDKISHMKNVFGDRLFEISVKAVVKALNYFTTMASRLPQVSISELTCTFSLFLSLSHNPCLPHGTAAVDQQAKIPQARHLLYRWAWHAGTIKEKKGVMSIILIECQFNLQDTTLAKIVL